MPEEPKYEYYRGDIPADLYNRLVADGTLNPDGTKPGSGSELGIDLPMQLVAIRLYLAKRFRDLRTKLSGNETKK